jgi:predicted NBD/HSP70 family sugar kinase
MPTSNPRPNTLKRINMRRFLEELRRRGPSTRADLTRAIGVTPPTSSSIIADLLLTGFLEETEVETPGKGRPGRYFRLATESAFVIGATIDIGECEVAASGLDGTPRIETRLRFSTEHDYADLVSQLAAKVRQVVDKTNGKCLGLGIAVPGLLDSLDQRVAFSPNMHFLDGRHLAADLEKALGIVVVLIQEEHALCLSEQLGSAKGLQDFAVVDFSSGVGMGVVSRGAYISGAQGFAGEIGHTTVEPNGMQCGCGNHGCLETVASDPAFLKRVLERDGTASFEAVAASLARDFRFSEDLDLTLGYIAIGLATVVNLFNPAAVFVHGRVLTLTDHVLTQLAERVRQRALAPSIHNVQLKIGTGNKLHGAVAGLLNQLFASVGPTLG